MPANPFPCPQSPVDSHLHRAGSGSYSGGFRVSATSPGSGRPASTDGSGGRPRKGRSIGCKRPEMGKSYVVYWNSEGAGRGPRVRTPTGPRAPVPVASAQCLQCPPTPAHACQQGLPAPGRAYPGAAGMTQMGADRHCVPRTLPQTHCSEKPLALPHHPQGMDPEPGLLLPSSHQSGHVSHW